MTAPLPMRSSRFAALLGAFVFLATGAIVAVARPWERPANAAPPGAAPAASAPSAPPAMEVDGVELTPRPVHVTVPATGSLAANESVPVSAELQRRLVRVSAADGARVKKGQILFKLDDADLQAQARELQVRRRLLADTEARQKKLLDDGLTSEADHQRAKAELDLLDAQVGSLGVTIARTSIRAPFDGRLGLRSVSEGTIVSPSMTLVTLQDDARIKIDFTLPERYASYVAPGQDFTFRIAGSEKPYAAKVSAVEPVIDQASRSLRVRGLTDNAGGELMVGAFVTVALPLESQAGGLLVPSMAVIPSLGGHGVWTVKDGKAALVEVELGIRTESEVQLTKGVSAGDVVLTTNLLRLRPGAAVKLGKVTK